MPNDPARPPRPSAAHNRSTRSPRAAPGSALRPPEPPPNRPGASPSASNVDNVDTHQGASPRPQASNVDTNSPMARQPSPFNPVRDTRPGGADKTASQPARQATPGALRSPFDVPGLQKGATPSGPRGPDAQTVRSLDRARERLLARSRRHIPGAGKHTSGVSEATLAHYANRGRLLVNRYKRESGIPPELDDFDPRDFAAWMLSRKPELKPSTWRTYRQGACYVIEAMPHSEVDAALRLLMVDTAGEGDEGGSGLPRGRPPRRTSALKAKRFPRDDFAKVINYLRYYSRSHRASELMDWLVASIHTGLRPVEWRATALEERKDGKVWLHVLNAKATNGRGNGLVRTLELTGYSPEVLAAIRRMSERGLAWLEEGRYDTVKSQIGQLLYQVCERLFPNRQETYALYSCRHQFIANMKTLHAPEEVSALVGHGSDVTAAEHYGKRRSGWPPEFITERPQPMPDEVATVRKQLRFAEERNRMRESAGLVPPGGEA